MTRDYYTKQYQQFIRFINLRNFWRFTLHLHCNGIHAKWLFIKLYSKKEKNSRRKSLPFFLPNLYGIKNYPHKLNDSQKFKTRKFDVGFKISSKIRKFRVRFCFKKYLNLWFSILAPWNFIRFWIWLKCGYLVVRNNFIYNFYEKNSF